MRAEATDRLVLLRDELDGVRRTLELADAGLVPFAATTTAAEGLMETFAAAARLLGLDHATAWRVLAWRDRVASCLVVTDCLGALDVPAARAVQLLRQGIDAVADELAAIVDLRSTTARS